MFKSKRYYQVDGETTIAIEIRDACVEDATDKGLSRCIVKIALLPQQEESLNARSRLFTQKN